MSDIKFIQIAVSETDDGSTTIALDEDGFVYEYIGEKGWYRLPGDDNRNAEVAPEEPEEEEEEEEEEDSDDED